MDLVSITSDEFKVDIDLAYATDQNFTGKPVYARPDCYLHGDAVPLLRRAAEGAAAMGLGLRIYDAFRPAEAQWVLWRHTPDPDFLADPRRGSPHSRGAAVDLTLCAGTEPLDMGTAFDAFTPLSHHGVTELAPAALRNRHLLLGLMTAAGWDFNPSEWWHYQLFDSRRYALVGDTELPRPMMPAAGV